MISISDTIQLQDIKIEDQPLLMKLLSRIYPPAYRHLWKNEDCSFYLNNFYSLENLEIELSDQDASYYFVNFNSKLVGIIRFICNKTYDDFPKTQSTYLNRIYLGKEAQGKGVASQLLHWIEEKVKKNSNTLIWLKAMDSQNQALRFYEKQGYNYGIKTNLDFQLIHPHLRGMYTMYKVLS